MLPAESQSYDLLNGPFKCSKHFKPLVWLGFVKAVQGSLHSRPYRCPHGLQLRRVKKVLIRQVCLKGQILDLEVDHHPEKNADDAVMELEGFKFSWIGHA